MFIIAALLSFVWIAVCAMGCARQWELNAARYAEARGLALKRSPKLAPQASALARAEHVHAERVQLIIPCDDIMYATGIPIQRPKED
jgi:hypothetical protein